MKMLGDLQIHGLQLGGAARHGLQRKTGKGFDDLLQAERLGRPEGQRSGVDAVEPARINGVISGGIRSGHLT